MLRAKIKFPFSLLLTQNHRTIYHLIKVLKEIGFFLVLLSLLEVARRDRRTDQSILQSVYEPGLNFQSGLGFTLHGKRNSPPFSSCMSATCLPRSTTHAHTFLHRWELELMFCSCRHVLRSPPSSSPVRRIWSSSSAITSITSPHPIFHFEAHRHPKPIRWCISAPLVRHMNQQPPTAARTPVLLSCLFNMMRWWIYSLFVWIICRSDPNPKSKLLSTRSPSCCQGWNHCYGVNYHLLGHSLDR